MRVLGIETSPIEYVSCNGTQAGSGVAANTSYTPTTPARTASGSLIPAVTISGTTAKTTTVYVLAFTVAIKESDTILIEINQNTGFWVPMGQISQDALASVWQGLVPIGMFLSISNSTTVTAAFSNAGRISGATYGTAAANWQGILDLGWKWRVKKISL